jgi:hypothetical protein
MPGTWNRAAPYPQKGGPPRPHQPAAAQRGQEPATLGAAGGTALRALEEHVSAVCKRAGRLGVRGKDNGRRGKEKKGAAVTLLRTRRILHGQRRGGPSCPFGAPDARSCARTPSMHSRGRPPNHSNPPPTCRPRLQVRGGGEGVGGRVCVHILRPGVRRAWWRLVVPLCAAWLGGHGYGGCDLPPPRRARRCGSPRPAALPGPCPLAEAVALLAPGQGQGVTAGMMGGSNFAW